MEFARLVGGRALAEQFGGLVQGLAVERTHPADRHRVEPGFEIEKVGELEPEGFLSPGDEEDCAGWLSVAAGAS